MKEFYSIKEISELLGNSCGLNELRLKALRGGWSCRTRVGVKGLEYEYELSSLPREISFRIYEKFSEERRARRLEKRSSDIWQRWSKASFKAREKAKERLELVLEIGKYTRQGYLLKDALLKVSEEKGTPFKTLEKWYQKTLKHDKSDWAAVLLDSSHLRRKGKTKEFTPQAFEWLKNDYLRPEKPAFNSCYYRLTYLAQAHEWQVPSIHTARRRLFAEVGKAQISYLREGAKGLVDLYPKQQRSVAHLNAFEWLNGDGYRHNVFVEWHNGEVVRPVTWFWQDVRTRKILGYRVDISENSDAIRLSLMDVIYKYGIPKHITIDNTRAAANKWLTGGLPNRYRFKVKADEPLGILPLLGIETHFTSIVEGVASAHAKPIERSFGTGGIGEYVDKHPLLKGFYTGSSVTSTPANYNKGSKGIAYDQFITALEIGINLHNSKPDRHTELGQGIYSFDQIWERDYKKEFHPQASAEQLRLLMLMSEATSIKSNGTFTLSVGGKVNNKKNIYLIESLIGSVHQKIVVRFDPKDLHSKVWCYSLKGEYLGEAICTVPHAFGSKEAGREHHREKTKWLKAQKLMTKALLKMQDAEALKLAKALTELYQDEEETNELQEIIQVVKQGSTLKKQLVLPDDEPDEHQEAEKQALRAISAIKGLKSNV